MPAIGILDLQGGVVEHLGHFAALGVPTRRVKGEADLLDVSGLVIPGGESTCMIRVLRRNGLDRRIRAGYQAGLKLWGTCAGAILMAREVVGVGDRDAVGRLGDGTDSDETATLGLMDIRIQRNAFGTQLDSFNLTAAIPAVAPEPIPLTFIRAPKIIRLGEAVTPLLRIDDYWAAVRDPGILATVFHPELTQSLAFHRYFARMCGIQVPEHPTQRVDWRADSWVGHAPIP